MIKVLVIQLGTSIPLAVFIPKPRSQEKHNSAELKKEPPSFFIPVSLTFSILLKRKREEGVIKFSFESYLEKIWRQEVCSHKASDELISPLADSVSSVYTGRFRYCIIRNPGAREK